MDTEPQPVIGWKNIVGFLGWLLIATGTFTIIIGCSSLIGRPCSSNLILRSFFITSAGALLLVAWWIEWGEEGPGVRSSPKSRLKKILLYALASPLIAIGLAILFVLGGLG